MGYSPWSGKESHAQTQPQEVNWHVKSHGWQMPELSSDPKLWVLFFFFFQSSVAHAFVHLKEKWPQERPWAGHTPGEPTGSVPIPVAPGYLPYH